MKRILTLAGVVFLCSGSVGAGVIDPALEAILSKAPPDKVVSTLVYLTDQVDTAELTSQLDVERAKLKRRHEVVVLALQENVALTQGPAVAHLAARKTDGGVSDYHAFWVANIIRVDAVPAEIRALADRGDVDRIYYNHQIELIAPVGGAGAGGPGPEGGIEPGVLAVRAPEVWAAGITGLGVLVATLDTGVDGNHPAVGSAWRGLDPAYAANPEWAFFDPVTSWTFPQDSASHGTHTMGTVLGGPPGDSIGVAPDAEWIHAAVIDRVNIATTVADAIAAFQWLIDPDGDPGTNFDVPASCSNSWGLLDAHGYPGCDQTFWTFLDACEAAGIVIIFSAGNEGTAGLRRPADRATDDYRTFAVGAVDGNNPAYPISGFSSQGPTFCTPLFDPAIKPDISAPGVLVRSSVPGGAYSNFNGTSMASPHINGVVALMRQANPDLGVDQIKQIIFDTALDLGAAGEDSVFGWGMVDAFEAVQQALATASLSFSFPNGRPEFIDPNGDTTIRVDVSGTVATPQPDSGLFYYSTGGRYTQVAMTEVLPNEYDAVFPSFGCGATVSYYFSAETTDQEIFFNPFTAPLTTYSGEAYTGINVAFEDDFESDLGWTVLDSGGLTTGTWERGVPAGGGNRGDPAIDADGSGQCFVTALADGDNDIDGGTTTLTSPNMDGSDPDAVLSYFRWYHNTFGADPANDIMVIDVSDNGGASWVNLETVGPSGGEVSGGWILKEFVIGDIPGITNTNQIRVRFNASDLNSPSVVEAGVDAVKITTLFCGGPDCPTDVNGDGTTNVLDLIDLLLCFGLPAVPGCETEDVNTDGSVNVLDLIDLLLEFGLACP